VREDYELSKAARGLDEISKSAKGGARAIRRALAKNPTAARNAQIADDRAARAAAVRARQAQANARTPERKKLNEVMASDKPLVLNANPPKATAAAPTRTAISDRPAPGATRRRLVSSASRAVQAHPYRTAALTGGVLVPAGAGAAYGVSRKKG